LLSRNSNHLGNEENESSQVQNVNMECIENEETYRNLIALVSGAIVNRQFDCHMDDTLDQVHDMSYLNERTNDNIFDQDQLNSLGLDSIGNISDIPTIKKICMKAATEGGIFWTGFNMLHMKLYAAHIYLMLSRQLGKRKMNYLLRFLLVIEELLLSSIHLRQDKGY
jgi:hypothetical protein